MERHTNIDYHKKTIEEIVAMFSSNIDHGMTDGKVDEALEKYGKNQEEDERLVGFLERIMNLFEDRTVKLLLAAAMVSLLANLLCISF